MLVIQPGIVTYLQNLKGPPEYVAPILVVNICLTVNYLQLLPLSF